MLTNNNLKICHKLVWREIRLHKGRSFLLLCGVILTALLFTVLLFMSHAVEEAYLTQYRQESGTDSQILYYDLSYEEAEALKKNTEVKNTVQVRTVGTLSDEVLEYRTIHLCVKDESYAETVSCLPDGGRMPKEKGEIALDAVTLDSLGISHETGQEVTLSFRGRDGEEYKETFTLCGYWDSNTIHTESYAWITEEYAKELESAFTQNAGNDWILGVDLYRPADLKEQAQDLLTKAGIEKEIPFETNLAYNQGRQEDASNKSFSYQVCMGISVLSSFFILYGILQVSYQERKALFVRMKAIGMSPRQSLRVILDHMLMICAAGVPLGALMGIGIFSLIGPGIVEAFTGTRLTSGEGWGVPLLFSVVLAVLTGCCAAMASSRGFINPLPMAQEKKKRLKKRRKSTLSSKVTVGKLARTSLNIHKGSLLLVTLSLALASVLLGSTYIRYISYDRSYYLDDMYISDYTVMDVSSGSENQRYNERASHITLEMAEQLKALPGVRDYGETLSREVTLTADEKLYDVITDFYSGPASFAPELTRKETMADDPDWMEGMEKFEDTGEYASILYGMEGLAHSYVLKPQYFLDGEFNQEKFDTGEYVISVGAASSEGVSSALPGFVVEIGGKNFTVMAAVQEFYSFPEGLNSRESSFNLSYVMPVKTLLELYPDTHIRQIDLLAKEGEEDILKESLAPFYETEGILIRSRAEVGAQFTDWAFMGVSVEVLMSLLLFFITLLGFLNMMVSKMLICRKEFALYQGLGMEKRQLKRMIFYEGLIHAGAALLGSLPAAALLLWVGMPVYYESDYAYLHSFDWAVTYRYSLMPFLLIGGIVAVLAVFVPRLCLMGIEKRTVVERLRNGE